LIWIGHFPIKPYQSLDQPFFFSTYMLELKILSEYLLVVNLFSFRLALNWRIVMFSNFLFLVSSMTTLSFSEVLGLPIKILLEL